EFLPRVGALLAAAGTFSPWAAAICALSLALVVLWPRVSRRIPGPLVALIVTTALVSVLSLPVDTIGSRFGGVPTSLPAFRVPTVPFSMLPDLVSPAIAIALLGGIESLLSAVVADGMTGRRHRSNAELLAQGVANIASPLFGGIPATGAIARTATNVKNGGRTPFAGMVHAVFLLLVLTTVGRWVALIPMAALAGILLYVAYNMSEWHVFKSLLRGPKSDVLVLLVTFGLTVLVDLAVAIQVGVMLAALLFMRRMAEVTEVRSTTGECTEDDRGGFEQEHPGLSLPPGTPVFEIVGSFFFGAAQSFTEALGRVSRPPKIIILRLREVSAMDATGMHALEQVHRRLAGQGTTMLLSGTRAQPREALVRSGALERFGEANVLDSFAAAVARAWGVVGESAPERRDGPGAVDAPTAAGAPRGRSGPGAPAGTEAEGGGS